MEKSSDEYIITIGIFEGEVEAIFLFKHLIALSLIITWAVFATTSSKNINLHVFLQLSHVTHSIIPRMAIGCKDGGHFGFPFGVIFF